MICYDTDVGRNENLVIKLALVAYFLAAGAFLVAVPWTSIWSLFSSALPALTSFLKNATVRGAVSGFGLVLVLGAVIEIRDAIGRKH